MKTYRWLAASLLLLAAAVSPACAESPWVGKQLPEASLTYFDGAKGFKGKPAVVEFWATWCGPCKQIIPHLNELHRKYSPQGLVIVGVSMDDSAKLVEPFRKTTPMEYTVAFDNDQKLSTALKVEAIPYAFVVDKTGKIVWEGFSSQLKDETLDAVVK